METIRGKTSQLLDLNGLSERLKNYSRVLLDLGTGDGRYVRYLADKHPDWFVIGVDSCRENLRDHSRAKLPNMLFVIARAQNLPQEFNGLISYVTVNFPWGSLLEGLLAGDPALIDGLSSLALKNARIDMHLNGGALAEVGTTLETGAETIYESMSRHGWKLMNPCLMANRELQTFPSTWARRLAHGRDPRAMVLRGKLIA